MSEHKILYYLPLALSHYANAKLEMKLLTAFPTNKYTFPCSPKLHYFLNLARAVLFILGFKFWLYQNQNSTPKSLLVVSLSPRNALINILNLNNTNADNSDQMYTQNEA